MTAPPLFSKIKMRLEWVPANLTYPKLKPAIRSAVAAWVSLVLFVIPAFERAMGQASFVILIGDFCPKDFVCWIRLVEFLFGVPRALFNVEVLAFIVVTNQ